MSTMFADTLLIVFISVCTALLAEGITWVLVYRTDKYKRLKAEVEKQSKKCLKLKPVFYFLEKTALLVISRRAFAVEKKKETITESAGRQQKKKIERQEEKLKNNNRDLSMVRMKSMFAIGFCFTALMGMFNSMVYPTATFWVRITLTAPSSSSTFSARCLSDRTSRRCLALLLPGLPLSKQGASLARHLRQGSSPKAQSQPPAQV
ncbi:calcium load-activated calcium channel isoform X2 [Apteryx rowi]|uniref:calcium load-activated calcium channel isoform X2 n=1 Tax=Apteryx rowi TaxID=308060 RepID=UPI000E1D27C5|nr:calcium load-activated calcium channel isoform X2 [Apteryx rowi]